jgi:hypothetical protein
MSTWLSGTSFGWNMDRFNQIWGSDLGLVRNYVAAFYDRDDEAALEIHNNPFLSVTQYDIFTTTDHWLAEPLKVLRKTCKY